MDLFGFLKTSSPSIGVHRDVDSLAVLHGAAYPVIFRFIAFRVGDREAAEQLTDELFAHLLEEPDRDENDPLFPQKLLLSMATRAVRGYQHSGEHGVGTAVSDGIIAEAMAALPEEFQILLALRYGCGLTIEQVGLALNKRPEAARQLQARAIMALHEKMHCSHGR